MVSRVIIKKGTYRDSISLMKLSNEVSKLPGVEQAAAVMATELNLRVLSEAGFVDASIGEAAGDDMIVAIEAKDEASLDAALAQTERLLSSGEKKRTVGEGAGEEAARPPSLEEALEQLPGANLVVISVPGQFARREAMKALERNLNVFLFSSNVSREEELMLKQVAMEKGLLVMGPDCGTSIINHKVLGFGNTIREGTIGLVSASGTGAQEVTTLIHKAGLGISQAIGTGGGDLSEQVGGIAMVQGIGLLEADARTEAIVLISKPPSRTAMVRVLEVARRCTKPIVVNFLGAGVPPGLLGRIKLADTLEDTARLACELIEARHGGGEKSELATTHAGLVPEERASTALAEHEKLAEGQRYVRGLFAGGTLCYESQMILRPLIGRVYSNAPIDAEDKIGGHDPSRKHVCIDMGAEEFVQGRAHPMIDFSLRNLRILQEARDKETAVILLDVELGYGSNPDPAGQLVPFVRKAKALAREAGRHLPVVASVLGTEGDSQGLVNQERALSHAGVLLMASNAQATRLAALIASGRDLEAGISGRPS